MKWFVVIFIVLCTTTVLRANESTSLPNAAQVASTPSDAEEEAKLAAQEERIRKALENAEFRKLHDILGGTLPKVTPRPLEVAVVKPVPPREISVAGDWSSFLRSEVGRIDKTIWNRLYNIENVETVGFKSVVYEFAATLPTFHQGSDRVARRVTASADGEVPVRLVTRQGDLVRTSREHDFAIIGNAFVAVTDSRTGEPLFARGGRLELTDDSSLALATPHLDGSGSGAAIEPLSPPVVVPQEHRRLVISLRGQVWSLDASSNETAVGSLPLVTFRDATRLAPRGGGFYAATAASGTPEPVTFDAEKHPVVEVRQGFLEKSNVDLDSEREQLEYLHQLRREYLRLLRSGDEQPAENVQ
ncbi:MAG: hypothetical protein ACRC46_09280 [Thermoguttaceae bacterium]